MNLLQLRKNRKQMIQKKENDQRQTSIAEMELGVVDETETIPFKETDSDSK